MSTVPFANSPKRSMGHLPGAKKLIFLIRDKDDAAMRPEFCQFAALRSPGSRLGVDTRRAPTPTPHARGLPSVDTYQYRSSASCRARAQVPQVLDPELSGEPQALPHAVYATILPQTYPRGSPRADLRPKKVNNLGPMAPRSRQKRQFF